VKAIFAQSENMSTELAVFVAGCKQLESKATENHTRDKDSGINGPKGRQGRHDTNDDSIRLYAWTCIQIEDGQIPAADIRRDLHDRLCFLFEVHAFASRSDIKCCKSPNS